MSILLTALTLTFPVVFASSWNFDDTKVQIPEVSLWEGPEGVSMKEESGTIYVSNGLSETVNETNGFIEVNDTYTRGEPVDNVNVSVNMYLRDISKIDTRAEIVRVDMVLNLTWQDPGLNWPKGGPPVNKSFQFHPDALK